MLLRGIWPPLALSVIMRDGRPPRPWWPLHWRLLTAPLPTAALRCGFEEVPASQVPTFLLFEYLAGLALAWLVTRDRLVLMRLAAQGGSAAQAGAAAAAEQQAAVQQPPER